MWGFLTDFQIYSTSLSVTIDVNSFSAPSSAQTEPPSASPECVRATVLVSAEVD